MGCSNCSTGGVPKGCKSNGSCGTGSCDKLTVFDWLSNMEQPGEKFDFLEIRFKNGRKEFFKNVNNISVHINDVVAVEGSPGHDIGRVSLTGELVRIQMKQKGKKPSDKDFKKLYRKANQKDIDTWQEAQSREQETMIRSRQMADSLGLRMKISDVEYQGDGNKATFYYTAEERVDFRQLIRNLAGEFKVRIEMRQIGARQEAGRVGGIGSCGRELCCSTWLTDFRSVNTAAARYQQLALNPQKLAGQCGKLKCCLNYELDTYLEALKDFPKNDTVLKTKKGEAVLMKMDIFKRKLWYNYKNLGLEWICLDVDAANKVVGLNNKGETPASLEDFMLVKDEPTATFDTHIEEGKLDRFDSNKPRKKRKGRKRPNRNGNKNRNQKNKPKGNKGGKPKS